jgi:hypothetical protein
MRSAAEWSTPDSTEESRAAKARHSTARTIPANRPRRAVRRSVLRTIEAAVQRHGRHGPSDAYWGGICFVQRLLVPSVRRAPAGHAAHVSIRSPANGPARHSTPTPPCTCASPTACSPSRRTVRCTSTPSPITGPHSSAHAAHRTVDSGTGAESGVWKSLLGIRGPLDRHGWASEYSRQRCRCAGSVALQAGQWRTRNARRYHTDSRVPL